MFICCRFLWQVCGYIPTTLPKDPSLQVSLRASQLSTSFVLETMIHAKEKVSLDFHQLKVLFFKHLPVKIDFGLLYLS